FFGSARPPTRCCTLSLHDALPIWDGRQPCPVADGIAVEDRPHGHAGEPGLPQELAEAPGGEQLKVLDVEDGRVPAEQLRRDGTPDRKSTRLNSSHQIISYAVFCLK